MRYTIHGYSQAVALTFRTTVVSKGKEKNIEIDATDLLILRWFADFYPKMSKRNIDGEEYAWVSYGAIIEDYPLLNIKKPAVAERMKKMSFFGILKHSTVKEKHTGTFAFYTFGDKYMSLIETKDTECCQQYTGNGSNNKGVVVQTYTGSGSNNKQNNPSTIYPSTTNLPLKENTIKENSEQEKKPRFTKPTIDEIRAYCEERNNGIDAEYFYAHYESKGWLVGKTPMKNWKMAVITWEKNNKQGTISGYSYASEPSKKGAKNAVDSGDNTEDNKYGIWV